MGPLTVSENERSYWTQPGFTKVNVSASYNQADRWSLTAYVNNMTNKETRQAMSTSGSAFAPAGTLVSQGQQTFTPDNPRVVGLVLQTSF